MFNSTKKGDAFEQRVFKQLKLLVENDEFFIPGKKSMLFLKKRYYSQKRNADIVFDISIETYLPNAETYSILTLFECKDLGRKVSVAEIHEFESKIREINEHNTKGVFVSTNGFQKGAYNLAKNYGIGLLRFSSNEEHKWINYRKPKFIKSVSKNEIAFKFSKEHLEGIYIVACVNECISYNLSDFLISLKVIDYYNHKESFIKIPFVSEEKIEKIIAKLQKYDVYDDDKLNMDKLCKLLSEKYVMEFDFNTILPEGILGKIEFDPLRISIDRSLCGKLHWWRFTLAHEIGHLILHSPFLKYSIESKTDTYSTLAFESCLNEVNTKKQEIQANIFASHLLMPREKVLMIVAKYFMQNNINKPCLILDNQSANRNTVFELLTILSSKFEVSIEAAKLRLKGLNLIKDETDITIYKHLKKIKLGNPPF